MSWVLSFRVLNVAKPNSYTPRLRSRSLSSYGGTLEQNEVPKARTPKEGTLDKTQIIDQLTKLAYSRSTPFCYTDYIKCPMDKCPTCGSDDLMLISENDGPEYGTLWIIQNILREELTPIELEKAFEEVHEDLYDSEVEVAWCKFRPLEIVKQLDPISWTMAINEWASDMEEEDTFFTLDGGATYYRSDEVMGLL